VTFVDTVGDKPAFCQLLSLHYQCNNNTLEKILTDFTPFTPCLQYRNLVLCSSIRECSGALVGSIQYDQLTCRRCRISPSRSRLPSSVVPFMFTSYCLMKVMRQVLNSHSPVLMRLFYLNCSRHSAFSSSRSVCSDSAFDASGSADRRGGTYPTRRRDDHIPSSASDTDGKLPASVHQTAFSVAVV